MSVAAGEPLRLKVFAIMRTSAQKAVRELRVDGLSAPGAEQLLDEVLAIEKAMVALKLLLADRAAESNAWRARGARSAEEDLARRSGTSTGQAKEVLAASKKVKDQPAVEDALRDGKLSEKQATAIADAAAADPSAQDRLVEEAGRSNLAGLRDACGRVKAAADRDPEATRRRIHKERFFRLSKGSDGSVNGSFKLTPQAGAEFDACFQPFLQREARQAKNERRYDTVDQLSADALVAMARASAGGGDSIGRPKQVYVVVDHSALLRGHPEGEEVCEISTCFGPASIPVSVAQEIIDDAFLTGVFMDGIDVQSVIRFGRHLRPEVRDALRIRDDFTCSTPGCGRRGRLEIDHHEPVRRGGPTRYTNLRHLCRKCHQDKTTQDRLFDDTGRAPPDTG